MDDSLGIMEVEPVEQPDAGVLVEIAIAAFLAGMFIADRIMNG